jgi:hypothetical protein
MEYHPMTPLNDALEQLIDTHTLGTVVEALAEVARLKAEHIASAWQDPSYARHWDRAARELDKARSHILV